jgi:uroporphyrinogen-III decarboxylase
MELVGLENMMMSYFTDPDAATKVMEALDQSSIAYGEALVEIGVESVFIENGSAGGEMVGLDQYEQWDGSYLRDTKRSYRSNGIGTICHNCAAMPFWSAQLEWGRRQYICT